MVKALRDRFTAHLRCGAVVLVIAALVAPAAWARGFSQDEDPRETILDPGDTFFSLISPCSLEVDDDCALGIGCLGVPSPDEFDLDAISNERPAGVCAAGQQFPGIVFSFDDGDPGPGVGPLDFATELFFYDRCAVLGVGGGSYYTNVVESATCLNADPPPTDVDDDVDAFEAREVNTADFAVVFSPDTPSDGALPADPGCPPGPPEGNLYFSDSSTTAAFFANPCTLGVPDTENCDIDAVTTVVDETLCGGVPMQLLFSTDLEADCGLDPSDIYISDNAGCVALWADDVADLQIVEDENVECDIDALSVNAPEAEIEVSTDRFEPKKGRPEWFWKQDYPDYAPSGMPDFSQDNSNFTPAGTCAGNPSVTCVSDVDCQGTCVGGFCSNAAATPCGTDADCAFGPCDGGGTTFCGPAAVANCFWWFDSKFEGSDGGGGSPGDGVDDVPIVEDDYGVGDDHLPANVEPLIFDLAGCMQTDLFGPGTRPQDMEACIDQWLVNKGMGVGGDRFVLQRIKKPTIDQIACEVERSENVILLLGFWWENPPGSGAWSRCGGHYVTSAGVHIRRDPGPDGAPGLAGFDDDGDGLVDEPDELCPCGAAGGGITTFGDDVCGIANEDEIAISDPGKNNAEPVPAGNGAPGRVRGPDHLNHHPTAAPPGSHDDAENVSHDVYRVGPSITGLYSQGLRSYCAPAGVQTTCEDVRRWCGQNATEEVPFSDLEECPNANQPVEVEIEEMIDLSPETCRDLCIDVSLGVDCIQISKDPTICASPAGVPANGLDYIRGECFQISESGGTVDLGIVDCLRDNHPLDQILDNTTTLYNDTFGGYFFLVREQFGAAPPCDYGVSSGGSLRFPSAGDCPCP